jgi:hypothetical protein
VSGVGYKPDKMRLDSVHMGKKLSSLINNEEGNVIFCNLNFKYVINFIERSLILLIFQAKKIVPIFSLLFSTI